MQCTLRASGPGFVPNVSNHFTRRSERRARALATIVSVAALAFSAAAWSDQDALQQQPAPENARDAVTPLESSFRGAPLFREFNAITDALHKKLQNAPPVIRDSEITLKPRVYYYDQEQPNGTIKEAVAGGGSLEYRSGPLFDRFRLGMELFTSQPIYAPEDRDGSLLLKPGQEGYTVLGQAYVAAKLGDTHELTAGRSEYDTPYVNRQFNRMTPNTFEGVSLKGAFKVGTQSKQFDYLVGYLSDIKQRNSDTFIPMSQAAGSTEEHGTAMTELLFSAFGASIGLAEYYTPDSSNIFYAEATFTPNLTGKWDAKLSVQGTDERALTGTTVLGGAVLGREYAARATFSRDNAVASLALSTASDSGGVVSPWGNSPSYTKGVIKNTARAGEYGALTSLTYGFARAGLEGLSAGAIVGYYWNARANDGTPLQDEHEIDLSMDYKVPKGWLKGLWFRIQRNFLHGKGDPEATQEWRVILNWEIPLL
jgi:outer membrane OprD family porin